MLYKDNTSKASGTNILQLLPMCEMSLFWRMFTNFNHFFYKAFLNISYQSALIQEKPPVQVGISLKKALIFYDLIGDLCLF